MYLEDYAEIAKSLGISKENARVKMNRIKTKIKKNNCSTRRYQMNGLDLSNYFNS